MCREEGAEEEAQAVGAGVCRLQARAVGLWEGS